MNKSYNLSIIVVITTLILVTNNFSQVLEQKIDSAYSKTQEQSNNCIEMLAFLQDSLLKASKPGGMAMTKKSCPDNITFPELKPNELLLSERLDLIIQKNPNYRWIKDREVINLLPAKYVPELLKVRIAYLKVSFNTNLEATLAVIYKAPEFISKVEELKLKRGIAFGGLQPPPSNRPPTEMVFHNKTLQEILNEIVKKHGRGVWLYREYNYPGAGDFNITFVSG